MRKQFIKYLLILFALGYVAACEPEERDGDKIVAEVGMKKLYLSEVNAVIPNNTEQQDSSALADDYVQKWIQQKLLLKKAEDNLSSELKNVTRELEEYRNSLIIFRYKNELMAQRMDTTVSSEQIRNYYLQNTDNFRLNKNIIKGIYLKIPAELANPDFLKEFAGNLSAHEATEIRDYCIQYAKSYGIYTDNWIELDAALQNIPVSIENPEQFLKHNQFVEYADSSDFYLLAVHDYMIKNEQAPVEYVQESIKSLILNRRKIDFLRETDEMIYREGVNKNSFKIYNIERNERE